MSEAVTLEIGSDISSCTARMDETDGLRVDDAAQWLFASSRCEIAAS